MTRWMTGAAALLLSASPVLAGGIERYNQGLEALFEEGNYFQLGIGRLNPTVEGTDAAGYKTGDVANGFNQFGIAYKHQFTDEISGLLMINQPFGADVSYDSFAADGSYMLGNTSAEVDSTHLTGVLRYKFPSNFGVHAGFNLARADAKVTLDGAAYGGPLPTGLSGYAMEVDTNVATGWLAGVSWERPDIAARAVLTYHSAIEHTFDTHENINPGQVTETKVKTPESWTLDVQSGVAADTLVFGQIRWVHWSQFKVEPQVFTQASGGGLVDLKNSTTYTLGVGRKFTDQWSGSLKVIYEPSNDSDLVSPLAPTNGKLGVTLAGIYTQGNYKITSGISYIKLGDAEPQTAGTSRAKMRDSDAVALGVRIGYYF